MRVILLLGKWLSQGINNIMICGHFLYDYIIPTNDLSNQKVFPKHVFGPLMRPWFLRLLIRATVGVPESTKFINLNSSYCRSKATAV